MEEREPFIIGYRCPRCGNEVGTEGIYPDDPVLCLRCDDGEYTDMEPVYDENNYEDE